MSRRVRLPAADELFRPTVVQDTGEADGSGEPAEPESTTTTPARTRQPSGRVRHDEKMTVYVTADELLDVEHARLTLRRHGLAVDRGRLIREALAMALLDLEEHGGDSALVQRLWRS